MSANPRFKPRVWWAEDFGHNFTVEAFRSEWKTIRVRVTDPRDLTAEKAIADTLTRNVWLESDGPLMDTHVPEGYSASVVNGKVRVRRIKQ